MGVSLSFSSAANCGGRRLLDAGWMDGWMDGWADGPGADAPMDELDWPCFLAFVVSVEPSR